MKLYRNPFEFTYRFFSVDKQKWIHSVFPEWLESSMHFKERLLHGDIQEDSMSWQTGRAGCHVTVTLCRWLIQATRGVSGSSDGADMVIDKWWVKISHSLLFSASHSSLGFGFFFFCQMKVDPAVSVCICSKSKLFRTVRYFDLWKKRGKKRERQY